MAGKKKNTGGLNIDMNMLDSQLGLEPLKGSDHAKVIDWLPTFIPSVDRIFGGGLPFGRMVEYSGAPGLFKSGATHHIARVATTLGCTVVLLDIEGTTDDARLTALGVDTNKVKVVRKSADIKKSMTVETVGEAVYNIVVQYHETYPDHRIVFIWDSIGQTASVVEQSKEFGEKEVGSRAAAIKQFLLKAQEPIEKAHALFIGINQIRADIGGNPMFATDHVPGGKQWEHSASLRIVNKNRGTIKKGDIKIGKEIGVYLNKSKTSMPFQETKVYMFSETGLNYEENLIRMAVDEKIAEGKGVSYQYVDLNGEIHKKKRDHFVEWLKTDEGKVIRKEIFQRLVKINFPTDFPALHNRAVDISGWEDAVGLADIYKEDNKLPENNDSQMSEDELGDEIENESKS